MWPLKNVFKNLYRHLTVYTKFFFSLYQKIHFTNIICKKKLIKFFNKLTLILLGHKYKTCQTVLC